MGRIVGVRSTEPSGQSPSIRQSASESGTRSDPWKQANMRISWLPTKSCIAVRSFWKAWFYNCLLWVVCCRQVPGSSFFANSEHLSVATEICCLSYFFHIWTIDLSISYLYNEIDCNDPDRCENIIFQRFPESLRYVCCLRTKEAGDNKIK